MTRNVGTLDSIIRIAIAIVLIILVVTKTVGSTLAVILGIIAAAFIITGLIGWCGLYSVLGIKTCKSKK